MIPPSGYERLYLFTRRGHAVHIHSDKSVFTTWMAEQPFLYPPAECSIIEYAPADELRARQQ